MTKIKNTEAYPIKKYPDPTDYFIGSDSQTTNEETVNFSIESVINMVSGLIDYIFTMSSLPLTSPNGDGYFETNGVTDFALVTNITISKKTLQGQDLSPLINFIKSNLANFSLYIVSKNDRNSFAYYSITNITENADSFVYDIILEQGNNYLGQLVDKDIYTFNYEKTISGDPIDILTQTITDGDIFHAPSADTVYDALLLKEDKSNKITAITGSSVLKYTSEKAVVDYVNSKVGTDFAKIVYVNSTNPTTATIFDTNNPPITNDNTLKADVDNLYVGNNASNWVYNLATTSYETHTIISNVPDATSTIKGKLKLTNDLGGTADLPTTPTAVHKTGNESITGNKSFTVSSGTSAAIDCINNGSTVGLLVANNTPNGAAQWIMNYGNGQGLVMQNNNTSTGDLLYLNGTTNSTGLLIRGASQTGTTFSLSKNGDLLANSYKKQGGTASQYLMADGSVSLLSAIVIDSIADADTTHAPSRNAVFDALALKQATLVSGNNIRTLNGNTLLGSTDLVIPVATDATTLLKGIVQLAGDLGGTADLPTTPTAIHKTGDESGLSGTKQWVNSGSTDTFVMDATGSGTLLRLNTTNGRTIQSVNNGSGIGSWFQSTSSGSALAAQASGTGPAIISKNLSGTADLFQTTSPTNVITSKIDYLGNYTAKSFIKSGGLSTQYLMADGSVSTGSGGTVTGTGTTNYLAKWTGANSQAISQVFDNGTNVLIGTTTDNGADKLQVSGSISVNNILATGNGAILKMRGTVVNANMYNSYHNSVDTRLGYIGFASNNSSTLNITNEVTGGHIVFTPTSTGNVGIGTTNPTYKTEIVKTGAGILDLLSLNNNNFSVGVIDGVRLNLRSFNIESSSTFGSTNNILTIGYNAQKQISLLQNGNVLIGTTTDNGVDELQVTGSAIFNNNVTNTRVLKTVGGNCAQSTTQAFFDNAAICLNSGYVTMLLGGDTSDGSAKLQFTNTSGAAVQPIFINKLGGLVTIGPGGAVLALQVNGNFQYSGTITQASDKRLKKNIKPLENSLEKILKINGVRYDRSDYVSTDNIGFIANDLEKVFPELVQTSEEAYEGGEGLKSVNYSNMVAVLVEAIKELEQRIKILENR